MPVGVAPGVPTGKSTCPCHPTRSNVGRGTNGSPPGSRSSFILPPSSLFQHAARDEDGFLPRGEDALEVLLGSFEVGLGLGLGVAQVLELGGDLFLRGVLLL